jgi:hypothetical protein
MKVTSGVERFFAFRINYRRSLTRIVARQSPVGLVSPKPAGLVFGTGRVERRFRYRRL